MGALLLGATVTTVGLDLADNASPGGSPPAPNAVVVTEDMFDRWCAEKYGATFRGNNLGGGDQLNWRCWGESNGVTLEREISLADLCVYYIASNTSPRLNEDTNQWECVYAGGPTP